MRLLHTSDWHLGRSFHRVRPAAMPSAPSSTTWSPPCGSERWTPSWSPATSTTGRSPPLAAVELFDDALHRLAELSACRTVMISGNHDSARRLGVGSGLIGRAGCPPAHRPARVRHARAARRRRTATGRLLRAALSGARRWCGPTLGAQSAPGTRPCSRAAMDRVRADLATRPAGTRSVVLAHAFVTGGRPATASGTSPSAGSPPCRPPSSTASTTRRSGHLHGCQTITERVRYSGSPLAVLLLRGAGTASRMWLVDLGADGDSRRRAARLPRTAPPRPAARHASTTCWPTRATRSTRTPGSRPPSPTPPARTTRWPGWRSASRTPSASSSNPSATEPTTPPPTPSG